MEALGIPAQFSSVRGVGVLGGDIVIGGYTGASVETGRAVAARLRPSGSWSATPLDGTQLYRFSCTESCFAVLATGRGDAILHWAEDFEVPRGIGIPNSAIPLVIERLVRAPDGFVFGLVPNSRRRHSALECAAPIEFERRSPAVNDLESGAPRKRGNFTIAA